jgi:hypothetical protein
MKHFISLCLATEKQFYAGIFAVLACLWGAIGAAILILLLMTLLPDCHGWGSGLRGLELVLPDPMLWST